MDAKYQKYYDKLKGVNLSSNASNVLNGCNSLASNTNKLDTEINSSTWEELGLNQIKTKVIPSFKQAVGICSSNVSVLSNVCSEVNVLSSLLESLDNACDKYNSIPDDEMHASEKRSYKNKINELESKIDSSISSINSLNSSIKDVVITVEENKQSDEKKDVNLENIDTGNDKDLNVSTSTTTSSTAKGTFTYYYQGDYKQDYGGGKTIAQAGCGPTSLAMVLKYYTGQNITPVDTANYARKHGYRIINNGTSDELFGAMCSEYGVKGEYQKASTDNIVTALSKGKTIIAHMGKGTFTKGGHYIVLKGLTSDGNVLVADPNHPNYNKKSFSASLISKESKGRMYVVG